MGFLNTLWIVPLEHGLKATHIDRLVKAACGLVLIALALACLPAMATNGMRSLDQPTASSFARLALRCVEQEYPNKLDHVMNNAEEVRSPLTLHPSFYGCFDWHSSVHGHWMLAHLLRRFPDLPEAPRIIVVLDRTLAAEAIRVEARYLDQPNRKSFERTYGWAWLLKLAEELRGWDSPHGRRWTANLQPLTDAIVSRYLDFLPRQQYPIRTGVHPNTAFGLAFALDYARAAGLRDLEKLAIERARFYFGKDTDYPGAWEPGGEDFFSPALLEADLMRRVLSRTEFRSWFDSFLPHLGKSISRSLLEPVQVSDRTDPKIVHLDGLNLSRAWCMHGIAQILPSDHPARSELFASARKHLDATLPHIASGNYEGEHWLATFAVLALSTVPNPAVEPSSNTNP
jgi:hypothetical protein